MTKATEIEVLDLTAFEAWVKNTMVSLIVGEDTAPMFDTVSRVCNITAKLRAAFDEAAKSQGNATIRQARSDSGKTESLTDEQRKAKAEAKAAALLG